MRVTLISCFLALLIAAPVMAQESSPQDRLEGMASEYGEQTMDRSFADVDRDGDRAISQGELREAFGQGSSERAFSEMDRDADGVLSEQEYMLPGNTGEVVSPGENPYEALNPGESGIEPLPQAEEYGITREQGLTGGVSPTDDGQGEMVPQPEAERKTDRAAEDETDMRVSPYGSGEERGPENYDLNGEMGDQEGRGPAEVPNIETYGSRDYGVTPEYDTPPAGAQGGSGIADPQGPENNPGFPDR